jgi:hypothetical protein
MTTITIAPKHTIESAIGMETKRGIVIMTGIEMTTATGAIHVETEMTRTEIGCRGAQKHKATNHVVCVN